MYFYLGEYVCVCVGFFPASNSVDERTLNSMYHGSRQNTASAERSHLNNKRRHHNGHNVGCTFVEQLLYSVRMLDCRWFRRSLLFLYLRRSRFVPSSIDGKWKRT
jgi:hypothetical protein